MSLSNVTQRRPRKSLLGTHRTKRESILPLLSDTLYSIYEEKKESNNSVFFIEKTTVADLQQIDERCPDPPPNISLEKSPIAVENSPLTALNDSAPCQEMHSVTSSPYRSPLPRRLDSLFSPALKDDSFVIHETMLANDDSVLAVTLNDVSPEADESQPNVTDAKSVLPHCDRLDSNEMARCDDVRDTEARRVYDLMLNMLDRNIQERKEFRDACVERIEELQKKVDELTREIDDTKEIKKFWLAKLPVPVSITTDKENFEPFAAVKLQKSDEFAQEMKLKVENTKTVSQSRKSRASALLTPRSMSFLS